MGQIIGNALSSGNYRTMASVARSQGRAQQAAYNLKANNLEEEARADSRLAALNMSRMRENQASNQASARARQACSGFAAEGSSMQNNSPWRMSLKNPLLTWPSPTPSPIPVNAPQPWPPASRDASP